MKKRNKDLTTKELEKYEPLVLSLAKKYKTFFPSIEIDELISEGRTALLEASLKYDPSKKTKFSTYAWFRIVKKMQAYISKNINIVEMPYNVRNVFSSIKKIINDASKKGKDISIEEVAKILEIDAEEVSDLLLMGDNIINAVSLDKEVELGNRTYMLSEVVKDYSQPDIFDIILEKDDSFLLESLLSKLSDTEKEIISLRFALGKNAGQRMSLKDIAEKLDLSQSKVKDIECLAVLKMKEMIKDINEQK